ncbi:MAG: hypothetical protein JW954_00955 [Dehalococcoidaceae bacterium]|nr:hypothetical protein [Dehalococcoidaceae bacterium]
MACYGAGLFLTSSLVFSLVLLPQSSSPESLDSYSSSASRMPVYHYIQSFRGFEAYWNRDWESDASGFYSRIAGIVSEYKQMTADAPAEFDCNDLAVGFWRVLEDNGINVLLAAGNLERTNETFTDCNHAWLIIYNGQGAAAAIETTTGSIYVWEQVSVRVQLKQYWEAFLYPNPEDMTADFSQRW